jgi:hypothetical protein
MDVVKLRLVGSLFYNTFSVSILYSIDDTVISDWGWMWMDLVGRSRGLI